MPEPTMPAARGGNTAEPVAQPSSRVSIMRALARTGGRSVLGLSGMGIAAAAIAAATLLPLPQWGVGPASMVVDPVAAAQERICAGPVFQLGDDTGQDATTAISLGHVAVERAATAGTPSLENMEATENPSNAPPELLTLAPPEAGVRPGLLAGSQSQSVNTPDVAGFAASECVKPAMEGWLVGGSTVTGRTTLISLSNPSKVSSTVKLTIYTETGLEDAVGTDGIVVPPGGRRVLSLAAFAPDVSSPIVHVESTGGQIAAALQQSIVRTLTPGGVDVTTATTSPSTLTIIPGIVTAGQEAVAAASALAGYDDVGGVLRVLVPGTGRTAITVTTIPEDGKGPSHTSNLSVEGGIVTDFPLGEFSDGTWTLTVASERPAVAAVRTSTVTLETASDSGALAVAATDFAWFVGAPELATQTLVSVAPGPGPMLHMVNAGTQSADVVIDADVGAGTTVTVAAGGVLAVPVAGGVSYHLTGFDSLRLAVSYHNEGALAGFVVSPPDRSAQPVTVFSDRG